MRDMSIGDLMSYGGEAIHFIMTRSIFLAYLSNTEYLIYNLYFTNSAKYRSYEILNTVALALIGQLILVIK